METSVLEVRRMSWRKTCKQRALALLDRLYWCFNQPISIKIIVVGAEDSGKTSIVRRFAGDSFYDEKIEPPDCPFKTVSVLKIHDKMKRFKVKVVELSKRKVSTSNQYHELLNKASGIVMVYSTDNPEQFDEIDGILKKMHSKRFQNRSNSTVVVLGNKTEIATDMNHVEKNSEVKDAVLSAGMNYFNVSAKSNWGIYDAFDELILQCALKKVHCFSLKKLRKTKKRSHKNILQDEENAPLSEI